MMSTRAAAFAGKISNLKESILRIQNGAIPQPSCLDLANMMKYFCQVLQDLKDFTDIENIPLYACEKKEQSELIKTLPNFDYSGLYRALSQMVDILPLIPASAGGLDIFGSNLLLLFKCLVPFLEQYQMETMPYLVSTLFMSLPQSLHKDIVDMLCFNLLPFIIDQQQNQTAKLIDYKDRQAARLARSRLADNSTRREQNTKRYNQIKQSSNDNQHHHNITNQEHATRPAHCIVRIEDRDLDETGSRHKAVKPTIATNDSLEDQGIEVDRVAGSSVQYNEQEGPTRFIDSIDVDDYDAECNIKHSNYEHHDQQNNDIDQDDDDQYDHMEGGEEEEDEDDVSYEEADFGTVSVTSILLIFFHYINEPMHHSQLLECLMKLKNNVFEDLIFVIAYGTTRSKCPAVELLFRYWPDICPGQAERKNQDKSNKLKHVAWQHTKCQNKSCKLINSGENEAVKMCIDFKRSMIMSDQPPPMLICLDCVDHIYKDHHLKSTRTTPTPTHRPTSTEPKVIYSHEHTNEQQETNTISILSSIEDYNNKIIDILLPMPRISKLCENKKCKSVDRRAVGTCFDIECANYNCKRPIRYCRECLINIHKPSESNDFDVTLQTHIRHSSLNISIMENDENINNFVEAIISLLKEAAPADRATKEGERYLRSLTGVTSQFLADSKDINTIATEEKQLISQYGIWLMTGLLKSVDKLSDDLLGRLLGMLFQWFHFTACLPDDQAGSALEKLKGECIKGWIMSVKEQRLEVFISCLLPHPIDSSKIGGHWEVWPDTAYQIKEGFKRLLCLVPYDIITDDIWDEIMPYWMECFRHEVPENELSELKILLSKVFDPELSPLGFETRQMYNFISKRFEDSTNNNQEQTLYWLQIITMLEIPIPIDFLFQMLKSGVKSLAILRSQELIKINNATKQASMDDCDETVRSGANRNMQPGSDYTGAKQQSLSDNNMNKNSTSSENARNLLEQIMKPMTQKERQASARAAFSAKLMQQASILDGTANNSLTSAGSISASPSTHSAIMASTTNQQSLMPSLLGQGLQASSSFSSPSNIQSKNNQLQKMTTSSLSDSDHQQTLTSMAGKTHTARSSGGDNAKRLQNQDSNNRATDSGNASGKPPNLKLKLSLNNEPEAFINKYDNNLICYILMLDITLKQLNLQEINSHKGLDAREAQQAIELLNSMVATPWIGLHSCSDTLPDCSNEFNQPTKQSSTETPISSSSGTTTTNSNPGITNANSSSHSVTEQDMKTGSKRNQDHDNNVTASSHAFGHCASGFEDDDTLEVCVFCEIISTFHQLALSLIEYFSPVIEVSICEIPQDAANIEFDGKPDYSRAGYMELIYDELDPKLVSSSPSTSAKNGPETCNENNKFNFDKSRMNESSRNQYQLYTQFQKIPSTPYSPTYYGPLLKPEILSGLANEIQLTYNLLVQFHRYQTPDIVSQLLQMIKLISLHSQVLSRATKTNPDFIKWCQHNMLIAKLWSLCELESSEIARTCVPLLLHCITLPWGVRLIRDILERDFSSENWLQRFRAVERVVTMAQFSESSTIKNSNLLQSTMASAFCYLVRCLDDIEAKVAQRALVSLDMMKTNSLKLLLWCLEVQFDNILIDRAIILKSVIQLYNHLTDRRFLTWEFFLNRFDTIFLEAQIYLQQSGEIPSFTMQDLKKTNTKSEIYQKKIQRARDALQEKNHSRSLSIRLKNFDRNKNSSNLAGAPGSESITGKHDEASDPDRYKLSTNLQRQHQTDIQSNQQSTNRAWGDKSHHHSKSLNHIDCSPLKKIMQHGKSTSSRYQTVAYLISQSQVNRKNSKFMMNLAIQSVPPHMSLPDKLHQHLPNSLVEDGSRLNEIAQENHVFKVIHGVHDGDRDSNHMLIFLLMQFLSKHDPSHPTSSKNLNRIHQIVLRHLNILMGYSVARRNFLISASALRLLPVFNAFLSSLPKVLDYNHQFGNILLDTCLPILVYCPAPDEIMSLDTSKMPTYSLWLLNPLMRQSWLMSVLTFLYKYQFGQAHLKDYVQMLMWIVINTLESHLNFQSLELTLDKYLNCIGKQLSNQAEHINSPPSQQMHQEEASESVTESPMKWNLGQKVLHEPKTMEENGNELKQSHKGVSPSNSAGSLTTTTTTTTVSNINKDQLKQQHTSDSHIKGEPWNATGKNEKRTKADLRDETKSDPSARIVGAKSFNQDERLLPIGSDSNRALKQYNKTTIQSNDQSVERLLPIGLGSIASNAFVDNAASTQQMADRSTPSGGCVVEIPDQSTYGNTSQNHAINVQTKQSKLRFGPSLGKSTTAPDSPDQAVHQTSEVTLNEPTQTTERDAKIDQVSGGVDSDDNPASISSRLSTTAGHGNSSNTGQFISAISADKKRAKWSKFSNRDNMSKPEGNLLGPSYSCPSLLNEQLAQINRHALVEQFSDKDLSMCLIILETFIHHEPSLAACMMPNILRLVARYSSANQECSQTGNNVHLVGGSMFVARQFIRVALHDLMDNNIFQQIFMSQFTSYEFYRSMALALADFPDLNQLIPLSKLFEDLNKQKSLPQVNSLVILLENVSIYFDCIISESSNHPQATWSSWIANWENFLRKLILALPRYSGASLSPVNSSSAAIGLSNASTNNNNNNNNNNKVDTAASIVHAGTGQGLIHSTTPIKSNVMPNQLFVGMGKGGQVVPDTKQNASGDHLQPAFAMMMRSIMRIILATTKIPQLASNRTIVDPYSKIICYTILNTPFKYEHLLEINNNFSRIYTKDREKYLIQRTIAFELTQVIKYRFFIPEENLLMLLLFILQDVGGTLPSKVIQDCLKIDNSVLIQAESYVSNISESLRQYISEILDFITDVHAISRINDNLIGTNRASSINRDSFGGYVKAALAQYLALELSPSTGSDCKLAQRSISWLFDSSRDPYQVAIRNCSMQFIDCILHIRQVAWIILGSLQNSALIGNSTRSFNSTSGLGPGGANVQGSNQAQLSQPIPIDKTSLIAEHIQIILAGFAEQSKESVLHMSGLFHAFLLCQLWTVYCETLCDQQPCMSEQRQFCQSNLDDFWSKITPGVLRLVGHSRVMSEMVSTHFLQLIESLIECNSGILIRYLPMWNSVFYSYKKRNKSRSLTVRLQKCMDWQPPDLIEDRDHDRENMRLSNWLEKVQYKMSHIEIQSSQAAPFYLT